MPASRICTVLTFAIVVFAQAPAPVGTIQGTLVDTAGNSVPGAHITVRNVDRGVVRNAETDMQAKYANICLSDQVFLTETK